MRDRHPLINQWIVEHDRDREAFKDGRGPPRWGFNKSAHRQHRLLSRIFFAVELHGVTPRSTGYMRFHFEYQGANTRCVIGSVRKRIPGTDKNDVRLHFAVVDPMSPDSEVYRELSDGPAPLEEQIPDIVNAILIAARLNAHTRRQAERSLLHAELTQLLGRLKGLEDGTPDGVAATLDPRTFQSLVALAEQHRSAKVVRRFLRSLATSVSDPKLEVAGMRLDDWLNWANSRTEELDPLAQGAERIFQKLAGS